MTGLLFIIIRGLLGKPTLDITVHDTYFVISWWHISAGIFLLYAIQALFYFFMRKHSKLFFGLLHFILQSPCIVYLLLIDTNQHTPGRYNPEMQGSLFSSLPGNASMLSTIVIMLLLGQVLFLANMIWSLVKMGRR